MMRARCFSSGLLSLDIRILRASGLVTRDRGRFICVYVDVAHPLGSVKGCSTARLQLCLLSMGLIFILEKLGELAESPRLPDKIKVAFDQARKEEATFAALMRDLCCSLWVSLTRKRRLAAELEGLGEQGDAVRALENMKEIVARDSVTLGDLEQLLARAQVGVDLKDGYLADVEEKV
ncbi:hypothetical protein Tco_0767188 [Tanacetum coccineum]